MKKVLIFVAILVLLPFGLKASVLRTEPDTTHWKVVGHNPTTISFARAVQVLPLQDYDLALRSVKYHFPDTIWVRRGDFFPSMTFGAGSICRNVLVEFDSTRALRWKLSDGTEIIFVLACNNVAWRQTTIEPTTVGATTPPIGTPTTKSSNSNIPWWWLLLPLLLLPFIWWWRRHRQREREASSFTPTPVVSSDTIVAPIPVVLAGDGMTSASFTPGPVFAPSPVLEPTPGLAGAAVLSGTALATDNLARISTITSRIAELDAEAASVRMAVDEAEKILAERERLNAEAKALLKSFGFKYVPHTKI